MTLGRIISFEERGDDRGTLVALEENVDVPFDIRRVYYIYGTKAGVVRGKHAHRNLQQAVIAVSGSCRLLLDNGRERTEVVLDRPNQGLLLRSMTWREISDFSEDCVLVVLADRLYDPADYIRDYHEFQKAVAEGR